MPYPDDYAYPRRQRPPQRPGNEPLTPERIIQAYERGFGRTPSQEEIDVHMRNPGGSRGFGETFVNSEEGRTRGVRPIDYANNWTFRGQRYDTSAPGRANTDATAPAAYTADRSYYAPFDWDRAQDESRSAKDTFLAGSQPGASDLRWQRKETAGAWFDQYIRPRMEARGWTVHRVEGDKAFVSTREATEAGLEGAWIDWVEGIDGPNPRLTWQDETMGGGRVAQPGVNDRSGTPRNQAAPPATRNPDGTVSVWVHPDAYRELAPRYTRRPRRRHIEDFVPVDPSMEVP